MRGLMKHLAASPAALIALTGTAMASTGGGGNLPWDGPLQIIEQDLSGTVAHVFVIIAIVTTGLFWTFGEHGSSMRKIAGIAAGGSIALGATSLVSGLGLGSGAVIGGGSTSLIAVLDLAAAVVAFLTLAFVGVITARTLFRRVMKARVERRAARMAAAEQARYERERELDFLEMQIEHQRQRVKELIDGIRRMGEHPNSASSDVTAVG